MKQDHGNSVHKHVWVMLLKKTKLSTGRTIVPAKIALFNAMDPQTVCLSTDTLLFTHAIVDSNCLNIPTVFLGEKE